RLDGLYKCYIRFIYAKVDGQGQHLLGDAPRPRDARGGRALSRPEQERDDREPRAQGVLARLSGRHRPDPARPRRQGGGQEMRIFLLLAAALLSGGALAQTVKIG